MPHPQKREILPFFTFFSSVRPPSDWMVPTPLMRKRCFTQVTGTNAVSSRNTLADTPRNNALPTVWASLSPLKFKNKINYCIMYVWLYFWAPYHILVISQSVFMAVPWHFDYWSFVKSGHVSSLFLLKIHLAILRHLWCHMNIRLFFMTKKMSFKCWQGLHWIHRLLCVVQIFS